MLLPKDKNKNKNKNLFIVDVPHGNNIIFNKFYIFFHFNFSRTTFRIRKIPYRDYNVSRTMLFL
jgi:hypothetical protein